MNGVVKITIVRDEENQTSQIDVTTEHISSGMEMMMAAIGLVQAMAHKLNVPPQAITDHMTDFFEEETDEEGG